MRLRRVYEAVRSVFGPGFGGIRACLGMGRRLSVGRMVAMQYYAFRVTPRHSKGQSFIVLVDGDTYDDAVANLQERYPKLGSWEKVLPTWEDYGLGLKRYQRELWWNRWADFYPWLLAKGLGGK